MKLFIIMITIFSMSGCEHDRGYPDRVRAEGENGNSDVITYKVNGSPLDCITKGHGLSCNWSKHNADLGGSKKDKQQ